MEALVIAQEICTNFILRPILNILEFMWMLLDTLHISLIIFLYYVALNVWAMIRMLHECVTHGHWIRSDGSTHAEIRLIIRDDNMSMRVKIANRRNRIP